MTKPEVLDFMATVVRDERIKFPRRVTLYQSTTNRASSGRAGYGRFHVTLGHDGYDHHEVVLHELTHLIVGRINGRWHSKRFWRTHYRLCRKYGVTPDDKRNVAYKAMAARQVVTV